MLERPLLRCLSSIGGIALACGLPSLLSAQSSPAPQFDTLPRRHVHSDNVLAIGDLDGDGDEDLVGRRDARGGSTLTIEIQVAPGRFEDRADAWLPEPMPVSHTTVQLADFDQDGDADLLLSPDYRASKLLVNLGGRFADQTATRLPADARPFQFADVDGDGDLDCLADRVRLKLLIQNASGTFVDASAQLGAVVGARCFRAEDWNADGSIDLVVRIGAQLFWAWGDGAGSFRVAPVDDPMLADALLRRQGADLDGDGALDLFLPEGSYFNDGRGKLSLAAESRFPDSFFIRPYPYVTLGDLDGDGDLDGVCMSGSTASRLDTYRNRGGTAGFEAWREQDVSQYGWLGGTRLLDLFGTNRLDLMVGRYLFRNDQGGGFRGIDFPRGPPWRWRSVVEAVGVEVGPGGRAGFLLGSYYGGTDDPLPRDAFAELLIPDGIGGLRGATHQAFPSPIGHVRALVSGDFDQDGDEDVILMYGHIGLSMYLARNDGAGGFGMELSQFATTTGFPYGVIRAAAVDLDGDGALDLLVAGGALRAFRNDGRGSFQEATTAWIPPGIDNSYYPIALDADGDGDMDCLLVRDNQTHAPSWALLLNDGTGRLRVATAAQLPAEAAFGNLVDPNRALAVDLDGDGDDDVIAPYAQILENRGGLTFVDVARQWLPQGKDHTLWLDAFDIDGDGDIDLFNTDFARSATVLLNDGGGRFRIGGSVVDGDMSPIGVGIDVDFDGDKDLVTAAIYNDSVQIFFNLCRHLHAPFAPRLGDPYTLEFYARSGDAPAADSAWPVASLGRGDQQIPGVGRLGLATETWFPLAPVTIPQPEGLATVSMILPADAGLVGLTVYFQAAMLSPGVGVALTNVLAETVID